MSRDPFDEIEKMFRKIMGGGSLFGNVSSHGVSIQRVGDKTKVDVHGDVSEEEIARLRSKYPNAEISVNGEKLGSSGPVEVIDGEESAKLSRSGYSEGDEGSRIVEVDEGDVEAEELALKRFREKEKEKEKEKEDKES